VRLDEMKRGEDRFRPRKSARTGRGQRGQEPPGPGEGIGSGPAAVGFGAGLAASRDRLIPGFFPETKAPSVYGELFMPV